MLFLVILALLLIGVLIVLGKQMWEEVPKNIYRDDLRGFNHITREYYELFLNPKSTINLTHNNFKKLMATESNAIDGVVYNYLRVIPKLTYEQRMLIFSDVYQHHTFMTIFLQRIIQDQTDRKWTLSQSDYDNALPIFNQVLEQMAQDILDVNQKQTVRVDLKNIYAIEDQLRSDNSEAWS